MKISGFCLTTNNIKNQFPFIESIKSFLPVLDELIIVDGGSTDGTLEAIATLNDPKIKVILDADTEWESEWFYSRMGRNFDRGLQECTGDWVIKFDVDYILHEKNIEKVRDELEAGFKQNKLTVNFTRLNFILSDRYFLKSKKTLAINKTLAKKNFNLHYGLDIDKWGFGYDFINSKFVEHGINFGNMLRCRDNSISTSMNIFNYDYMFMTEKVAIECRYRHFLAEEKQRHLEYKKVRLEKNYKKLEYVSRITAWNKYLKQCKGNFFSRDSYTLNLSGHPEIIQDKIENLSKDMQGFNAWGLSETINNYYV